MPTSDDMNLPAVWILHHVHAFEDGEEDVKLIGCYSTEELAWEAVERKKAFPGFAEHPGGFTVDRYEVNRDYWSEGYVTVSPDDE